MVDVSKKKVICRVDFNVPLNKNLEIADDLRIKSSFKTINYLLANNASVILMSHLGRPKGKVVEELRLIPIYKYLKTNLKANIYYVKDCIGAEVETKAKDLKPKEVLLLENLRFHKEETDNDPEFSRKLSTLAELYVNDAFGTAHRAHASTEGITKFLPSVAGFLMTKELDYLIKAVEHPKRPLTAIIGGKKVKDKINVLKRLVEICDNILIGGGMAYTFLKVKGFEIGNSILDKEGIETAKNVMEMANKYKKNLILPVDIMIADEFNNDANKKIVDVKDGIPKGWEGLDIGPKTIKLFNKVLEDTRMLIWNGPVGVFELPNFAIGTEEIIKFIAENSMVSIIGGGDTAAAIQKFGFVSKITHISTGGGAALEVLEGKQLPGLEALDDA